MSTQALDQARPIQAPGSVSDLYRAVWRWHFYAGLLVLPFLIILAATGALYLFRDEIDTLVHADLKQVREQAVQPLPPIALVERALAAHPGTAVKFMPASSPASSAEVTVATEGNARIAVYLNPYDGRVLGSLPDRGTVMWIVREIHSLAFLGPVAQGMIEIAGAWSIMLVGTGVYLWWPRGQAGGVVSLRGTPRRRVFWRDLHAVTGAFVGVVLVFLAATGMPWSVLWGAKVNEWANGQNFGYPAGVRVAVPMSDEHLNHIAPTTWSLEQAKVPESTPPGSTAPTGEPIGLDRAVAILDGLGLHAGYVVNLPRGPRGVYTGSVYPDDLSRQRVVHLDQYSGRPLIDMSYADYGPLGRGLEWGINVHLGREFGLANQLLLLAACLAIIVLSASGAVMWWKRRPRGSLGVPPAPADRAKLRGVVAILAVGGIVFPLAGLSLVAMLALDRLVTARRRTRTA
ncbi:PepSY-associated TM helix domain-containing protein [Arenibaculum pallidiluteum]|uniref:PepSY-associated TM helix domain-containing protein n=1 Tax=Arenibaculum pallidiluteum TaxID=2812559 RepID=UPI001A97ADA0|nr:PepSY domain-containing protein [Arenibaculum pallidiluteum]